MAERYPKRKLSTEEISRALNFDSDSDDSNDKLEKLLGEDSGSDIEFTLHRPRKYFMNDSDSDTMSDSDNINERKRKTSLMRVATVRNKYLMLNEHIASVHEEENQSAHNDCMIMCHSCEKPATHFCKSCDQNLCKFCIIDHYRNTNFTKNHDMIPL